VTQCTISENGDSNNDNESMGFLMFGQEREATKAQTHPHYVQHTLTMTIRLRASRINPHVRHTTALRAHWQWPIATLGQGLVSSLDVGGVRAHSTAPSQL
jgi:hypothetical protein